MYMFYMVLKLFVINIIVKVYFFYFLLLLF